MYGGYNPIGSPPLPDIIGPYYAANYGSGGLSGLGGLGIGGGLAPPLTTYTGDMYGGGPSTGYLYDPTAAASIYGSTSPIRRRRYSIAGLPSATMMNDYYSMYPSTSLAACGLQAPLQHSSSSNLVNLLSETHKSISRSSQILNQHARLQQAQPMTPLSHYPGRVISSYPTLHPGGDVSPPYLNDNLLQMSTSFSSQPNMYFQQYTQPTHPTHPTQTMTAASQRALLRPAYSVSNLSAPMHYPSRYTSGGVGIGSSYTNTHPYSQSLLNHSDLPYILQQRQLLSSLHASNPAISQYYQQQLPHYLQHYAQQPTQTQTHAHSGSTPHSLAYNLQQQFAGSHHYGHQLPPSVHPSAHIHHSVQQQLNPNHQYHVHSQQNHLQSHPLAALANTTSPFGVQLASSALNDARATSASAAAAAAAAAYDNLQHTTASAYHQQSQQQAQPTHHHHHPHVHHPTAPHTHHPTPHHHHHTPYSKLDLDYPKFPQEHKRQVSFKFDVDQLSLDS